MKAGIEAILTDIEGTTSSIRFVHEVLFPYAARHLPAYVREHEGEAAVAAQLRGLAEEAGLDRADAEACIPVLLEWIATDRKATPLKALQGMVWEAGYTKGDFQGHVYDDAAAGLRRWKRAGIALYVYSSGSVPAQKLLFAHTPAGDLTSLFSGYFDTRIGAKRDPSAYERIVAEIGRPAGKILFLSDVEAELDAARAVGMATAWSARVGNPADSLPGPHPVHAVIHGFDEVDALLEAPV